MKTQIIILLLILLVKKSGCAQETSIASNRYIAGEQYLEVELIEISDNNVTVSIRWDKSWRDTENWDAAWIFLKDGSSKTIKIQEIKTEDEAKLQISADSLGFYAYRKAIGEGKNNWRVEIFTEDAEQVVKAHGLEMVFVPKGPFELGTVKSFTDRNNISTGRGSRTAPLDAFFTYNQQETDGFGGVYKINDEGEISIGKQKGDLYYIDAVIPGTNTFSGDKEGRLEKDFPKGYRAFYQMKYELSEQEYCDFLNSIPKVYAEQRFNPQVVYQDKTKEAHRNTISLNKGVYTTTRPQRACNFLSWKDILAYADWACLRPMTELEFEKSARGPKEAVWREFVWGVNEKEKGNFNYSTTLYDPDGSIAAIENGNEYTDGNAHVILLDYGDYQDVCDPEGEFYQPSYPNCRSLKGGDGGRGPLRKGIHGLRSMGNRVKAGASYYGAMDLGGNLQEPVIPVGSPFSRKYKGTHGDGELNEYGEATNADWNTQKVEDYVFGFRGGSWPYHENHARIADRFDTYRKGSGERKPYRGFRGVRTVL